MSWLEHNKFVRGDPVVLNTPVHHGPNVFDTGTVAVIESVGANGWYEVNLTPKDRLRKLAAVHANQLDLMKDEPEDEPDFHHAEASQEEIELPPAMGWYAALAEEHIRLALADNLQSHTIRHLRIADIYARLELAAATDRSSNR